ncbi:MAG: RNA polymerase sigma factor [Proteobacteria bacterium]|nr:RNA polymerase sigma factor [Pseudomonadota bacterium]
MEDPAIRAWFAQVLVHEPHLRSYLRRVVGDRVDISDVVQETYARLIALSPSQRGAVRTVRAFLFTTARHVALDHLRRLPVVSLDALTEVASTRVVTEGEVEPPPDQNLNTCQELELLARVIASLPDKCREVLTLRKIHGLSQKEIAARLGIAEHTVEKHVSYGVRLCAARMLETMGPMDSSAAAVPAAGQGRVRNVE